MEKKVITISTQVALFFEDSIPRPDTFYNKINSDLGELIDAMPQTLPLPPEAPAEIPRVMGTSSFGQYTLNVALNRVDLLRNYNPNEDIELAIKEFKLTCTNLIANTAQYQKIIRIGIVGNHYVQNKNPNLLISKLYLNEKNKDSDEISIRINKKSKIQNITVNNVININQGIVAAPNYNGDAVLLQLDYNTDPQGHHLSEGVAISIFKEKSSAYSSSHVSEICGL